MFKGKELRFMILTEEVAKGDVRSTARLIRNIEDRVPSSREELKKIHGRTGQAYILGVTGSPGAGKSTIVDGLIGAFRAQGKTIGVIAVDPTSPISGGSILGDRVRMQQHTRDKGVFIRSMATRGHLGGVSRCTHDIVDVLDAMGKDVVVVETVGAGQDEVEVAYVAHTNVVVIVPGMGDDIQAIKAGILEVADIFVVNKADKGGADKTVLEIETMLDRSDTSKQGRKPPVLKIQANRGIGMEDLLQAIDDHRTYLSENEQFEALNRKRVRQRFMAELQHQLLEEAMTRIEEQEDLTSILEDLVMKRDDPHSRAEMLVKKVLR
jgi:LAO/AO transport system kinase